MRIRFMQHQIGLGLTLVLSAGALWAAIALGKTSLLWLGFVVGLVVIKAKDGLPWPRVVQSSGLFLLLCCVALLIMPHLTERPVQTANSAFDASSFAPLPPSVTEPRASAIPSQPPALTKGQKPENDSPSPQPTATPSSPRQGPDRAVLGNASDRTDVDAISGKLNELQDQLKELRDGINQTVTIWSVLIAALTVVLSFVTSWVIGIAKDAKDQVTQLSESARLQDQLMSNQRETLRQANWLEVNRYLEHIPGDHHSVAQYQFLLQVRRALVESPRLHDPFGLPEACKKLEYCLLPARNIARAVPDIWNSAELQNLRERLVTWFTSEYQIAQDLPHLRGANGDEALEQLRGWVRLLRQR